MKHLLKYFLSIFAILLVVSCSKKNEIQKFTEIQWEKDSLQASFQSAVFENDFVMIDFQTDWCVWCRKLEKDTFSDSLVIEYVNSNFSAYSIDAEKGQGIDLAKHYHVSGFPTIVFTDKTGDEVDRIIGYLPADAFLKEIQRIKSGENTYPDILNKTMSAPKNVDYLKLLAEKQENMWGLEGAKDSWAKLHELAENNSDAFHLASFKLVTLQMDSDKNIDAMKTYLATKPPVGFIAEGFRKIVRFFRITRNVESEVAWNLKLVKFLKKNDLGNSSDYNGFAWRMTELEKELESALEYAKFGISLTKSDLEKAQVMDTMAEVLWKLNRDDEAINVMEECIKLQPEDEYYQKQKAKYSN